MTLLSRIERTLRRWENLLDASGWEIIRIWGKDSGREQLIECQLKDYYVVNGGRLNTSLINQDRGLYSTKATSMLLTSCVSWTLKKLSDSSKTNRSRAQSMLE